MSVPGGEQKVKEAVQALVNWKDCQSEVEKAQLLSSDEFVYLVVTLKKIPAKGRTNPYKIPLVHPLFGEGSELCLFVDDRTGRLPSSKDAKSKIASESIPISKVIKLSKLKTDYKPFEAKRKLCDSYDLFLSDRRIVPLLPKHIGKHFYLKKKVPMGVDLEHKNWKEQVERVCSSAFLHMNTGTCCSVKVARCSMSQGEIVENVVSALNGVAEILPSKWEDVRSLNLKFSDSVSLTIYQSLPEVNLKEAEPPLNGDSDAVPVPVEKKRRREQVEDVKVSSKASSKKGRIHQVRYMDDVVVDEASEQVKKPKGKGNKKGSKVEVGDAVVDEVEEKEAKGKKKKKNSKEFELGDDVVVDEVKEGGEQVKKATKGKKKKTSKVEVADEDVAEEEEQVKKGKKKKISKVEVADEDFAEEDEQGKKGKKKKASKVKAVGDDVVAQEEEEPMKKATKGKKKKTSKIEAVGGASAAELDVDDMVVDVAKDQVKKKKAEKKSSKVEVGDYGAKKKKKGSEVEVVEEEVKKTKKRDKVSSNVAKSGGSAKKSKRS